MTGVVTADGRVLKTKAVIVATGTFLRGMIHLGKETFPAGPFVAPDRGGQTDLPCLASFVATPIV